MIKPDIALSGEEIKQSVLDIALTDQLSFGASYIFIPDDTKEKPRNVSLKEIYNLK